MRRSGLASLGSRVFHRKKIVRAAIEAIEPRLLLSTVHPAAAFTPGDNPLFPVETFIDGTVYEDTNNNGIVDPTIDTPLGGQTIFGDQIVLGHDAGAITSATTGTGGILNPLSTGEYELFLTGGGTFRVRLAATPGLAVETTSPALQQDVFIPSLAAAYYNADFLVVPQATVSGTVFNDANHNGIQDPGEVGESGQTVWVDVNKNGVLDPDDVSAVSDSTGHYTVLGVPPGTFTMHLSSGAGVTQTSPATTNYAYTFSSGQNITGANFGTVGADLTVTLENAPPVRAIGAYPVKPAIVSVTNTGNVTVDGLVGVALYLSKDNVLDSTDFLVGGIQGKHLKLKPGQSKTERIKYTIDAGVPTGNYHLIAQVLSSTKDNKPSNDTFASTQTIAVSQPTVDVGITYPGTQQLLVHAGQPTALAINVTNNGNVMFIGDVTLKVYASSLQALETPVGTPQPVVTALAGVPNKRLKLHPHQTKVIIVPIIFTGLDRELKYLVTTLDVNDPLGDSSVADNVAVTALPTDLR